MQFLGKLAVGTLYLGRRRAGRHAENLIGVFHHGLRKSLNSIYEAQAGVRQPGNAPVAGFPLPFSFALVIGNFGIFRIDHAIVSR